MKKKDFQVVRYQEFLEKKRCDLLFVNDGSKDDTITLIKSISNKNENALVLNLNKNKGKAMAVREGMLHALSIGKNYDYLGLWDADLATPLDEVVEFQDLLKKMEIDCIFGSRVRRLGCFVKRKWYRHLLGRIFATIASWVLGLPIYDTQCGAKIFRRDIVKKVFEKEFISYWAFDVEVFFRLKKNGIDNLYELPLKRWEDVGGSKLGLCDFIRMPFELLRIWLYYR